MIAALLAVAVLASWLGCAGLLRLPTPTDRLHLVAFVNIAAGIPLLIAGVLTDGATPRAFKMGAIVAINLLSGAAASHAIGRALRRRGEPT